MIAETLAERRYLPDALLRNGMRRMLGRYQRRWLAGAGDSAAKVDRLAARLRDEPIALLTEKANEQHYEIPPGFFELVLGPRLKYSGCHWGPQVSTLAEAEEEMLALTCQRAELQNGQRVLDLGCGWGSLSLWIAEHYPRCHVTAVSNSRPQREFIEARCRAAGCANVHVTTGNIAELELPGGYDRIVSVEMFEHLRNWPAMLARLAGWLADDGKAFIHVFCHRDLAYTFDDSSWMGRHFFSGGMMPAADLLDRFQADLQIEQRWLVEGTHYARTCGAWLANLDAQHEAAQGELATAGYNDPARQLQRWRMFLMAGEEMFSYEEGQAWQVAHYRLRKHRSGE